MDILITIDKVSGVTASNQADRVTESGANIRKICDSSDRTILLSGFADLSPKQVNLLCTFNLNRLAELGSIIDEINGTFAILVKTPNGCIAISDHSGSIPIFRAQTNGQYFFGTHVGQLVANSGLKKLDPISVAEFCCSGLICHPYTLYHDVRIIPPGTVWAFRNGVETSFQYWAPGEPDQAVDLGDFVNEFRSTVRSTLDSVRDRPGKTALMYSGGEDSRVLLSELAPHDSLDLICLADHENREFRLAQGTARKYGYSVRLVRRPEDHYRAGIDKKVKRLGPGFDVRHCHFFGETEKPLKHYQTAVGGLGADKLFKSHYIRTQVPRSKYSLRPERLSDRQLPLQPFPSVSWVSPEIRAAIDERWAQHRDRLRQTRPDNWANWIALWPLAGHGQAHAQFLNNLRIGPAIVEPFICTQAYKLAAAIPDELKLNRTLYRKAFLGRMKHGRWRPITDGSIPGMGGTLGNVAQLLVRTQRFSTDKIRNMISPEPRSQGPWSFDHKAFPYEVDRRIAKQTRAEIDRLLYVISGSTTCSIWQNNTRTGLEARVLLLQIVAMLENDDQNNNQKT